MSRRQKKGPKVRPAPDPLSPNAAECSLYVTCEEFRGLAIRLHAKRVLTDEVTAERRIRDHLTSLKMSPEPGHHPTPLYEKAN